MCANRRVRLNKKCLLSRIGELLNQGLTKKLIQINGYRIRKVGTGVFVVFLRCAM